MALLTMAAVVIGILDDPRNAGGCARRAHVDHAIDLLSGEEARTGVFGSSSTSSGI